MSENVSRPIFLRADLQGSLTVSGRLTSAVKLCDKLSTAEQEKIIEWSEQAYGGVWNQLPDLLTLSPPEHLMRTWGTFMTIVRAIT